MVELNDTMKDCIIDVNNERPDLDYVDTVIESFRRYVSIVGEPVEIEDDEEGEELLSKAMTFLIDCVLFNLIEKGLVEIEGMEDGELVYKATIEL